MVLGSCVCCAGMLPFWVMTGFLKRTGNKPENRGFLINDCTAPLTVIVVVTAVVRLLGWH